MDMYFDPATQDSTNAGIQVPAGQTRYFDVVGTVASAVAGSSVSTSLLGDAAFIATSSASGVDAWQEDDFIWSANATTTALVGHVDWTNGTRVPGLPSTNISAEVLTK